MPILKLHLENVGPFDKLELDLTDGNGKAHLGPHILTGVNGSGKTTVLRAIAWCLAADGSGFDKEQWQEFLEGRTHAMALLVPESLDSDRPEYPYRSMAKSSNPRQVDTETVNWASRVVNGPIVAAARSTNPHTNITEVASPATRAVRALGCIAAYAPSPVLRWVERPPIGLSENARANWLSFKGSVTNEDVQAFWVAALSRESLLATRGRETGQAKKTVDGLRSAIHAILDPEFEPDLNIDVTFPVPVLRLRGTDLNFSQLAAGFNATLSWVVDYLLRQELFEWPNVQMATDRPGVILIDEIETHLHPQWQRQVLNGIRKAFPKTQIIVTTHSPFVVSSSEDARVHVLKLDAKGKAYLDRAVDGADGASVATTIRSVFEIASQFGPEVAKSLNEWNGLKKKQFRGKLSKLEAVRLKKLAEELAKKGEELASLVADPPVLPKALIDELVETASKLA